MNTGQNMLEILKNFRQAIINSFLILGVIAAVIYFAGYETDSFKPISLTAFDYTAITFASFVCLFFASYAWLALAAEKSNAAIPLVAAVEQTSLMLISKYIPGKIWGIFIRSVTTEKYGISTYQSLTISLKEQLLVIIISSSIGLTLATYTLVPWLTIPLLLTLILFGNELLNCFFSLSEHLFKLLRKTTNFLSDISMSNERITKRKFIEIFSYYSVYWAGFSTILIILAMGINGATDTFTVAHILASYLLATIIGFLAIFAPGGIGVRESVFVILASLRMDPVEAVQLSLYLRIWNILFDIASALLGIVLLNMFSNKTQNDSHA